MSTAVGTSATSAPAQPTGHGGELLGGGPDASGSRLVTPPAESVSISVRVGRPPVTAWAPDRGHGHRRAAQETARPMPSEREGVARSTRSAGDRR